MYISILLCSMMGCFFSPNAFENAPGDAFENGVQRPRKGNPYLYSVSGVSEGQQLAQQVPQICNVVPGNMLKMRHLRRKIPDCDTSSYTLGSGLYQGRSRLSRADMPRTAGRMRFWGSQSRNFHGKAQNQGPGKMAKYICVGAPLLILCVFVARLAFAKNGVFKIDNFSLKPLKTQCETVTVVPKYFSLNWHARVELLRSVGCYDINGFWETILAEDS